MGYGLLYLVKHKKYYKAKTPFPFRLPFILIFFSYFLTCFFALSGFALEFARAFGHILRNYIFIWILWDTIETEKDFQYLFKGITLIIFLASIYGIIEYFMQSNPLLNYKVILSSNTISLYNANGPRGYRLVSFFEHPIGAGMTLGLYTIFALILWINKKEHKAINYFSLITALLCLPCIILTKMRSAILFIVILAISLANFKNLKKKRAFYLLILLILCTPMIFVVLQQNINLILNLFSKNTSSIGGSSLTMRLTQLNAIFNIFKISPIAGLGETFREYITRSIYTDAALGYEGLIFEKATMHGIIGIIVFVIFIYYTIYKVPKYYKSREARIFALAYWIVYLFSSIPSFRISIFFLAEFYFIKSSAVYKKFHPKTI